MDFVAEFVFTRLAMQRPDFSFSGSLAASKSLMNRALIVQSFSDDIKVHGFSQSEDVVALKHSLKAFANPLSGTPSAPNSDSEGLNAEAGGTTLRFLALRVSRKPGTYRILGTSRLLARPQGGLQDLLRQLGVQSLVVPGPQQSALEIQSDGWRPTSSKISVDRSASSQFASALVLSAWDLPFDLEIEWDGDLVSDSYFQMTLSLLKNLGLSFRTAASGMTIPRGQKPARADYEVEPDISSCFAVAAMGALQGRCEILNYPETPLQPDHAFVEILRRMSVPIRFEKRGSAGGVGASHHALIVSKAAQLLPVEVDLLDTPDLFPVLAVLASQAQGVSKLLGAKHLAHKESNRILKIAELLTGLGGKVEVRDDGMIVTGGLDRNRRMEYDPDQDHRLAMAGGILQRLGYHVKVLHPQVVSKSFPDFWEVLGITP